ncbi:MAG: translation initiation factor IF-2 subunit alpha [Candidatus Thermoplasmatota archaeon]|nr:translation initiation factor IF-2 subunit alpha [Candidatus Thermoplasmatota archaeon]
MMKKEYPEEGELIVGTITKVQGFGAFVSLDEYPNREGFIHISEIATGWVKRIRNFVREKQKVVCKVVHVDVAKKHIDLSLKKVNDHQRREKIQEWKNAQKAAKLFEMVATGLGKTMEQCYQEFGESLAKKYGTLYAAFEECAYDSSTLKNDGFSGEWLRKFEEVAKASITVPFVEIKGMMLVTSFQPDGVMHIREALTLAGKSEFDDVTIDVKYIGAPRYLIKVKAPDYKIAEAEMKKAVERVQGYMKSMKGDCEFQREVED